ncbi:Ditrans,polycis-undecaprenyl-diphosphate synthase ((2E,6E)-farnesyl-diphosphate specific) [Candidatus Bandiella woodruffii]|uniref:Isoprenyl transferase n=2 Tax=Candidatus Bandiella euplotis TaxID=1664265 RepID=A0ABZ0UJD5_9RICK|nr:Ditrans,polycis-undecaprenyl-diphosphate synthase ((2E,6E)-farnesyl-diphosphate specific) [Candidatus Bandiella woodruffii]
MNNMKNIPRHIAIIMDGNGRWAKHNNVPKLMGYQHGIETAQTIIEYVKAIGVQYLTLYAFSLENWQRPKTEVDNLMNMFRSYLTNDIDNLIKNDIRVIFIGQRNKLEADIRDSMLNVEEKSSRNNFKLIIAISYGSRDEVVNTAVQFSKFYDENIKNPDELFASIINPHNIPDPDLLIRTGGEHRLSNFLLWQMAYTELFFIDKFWPDFAKQDLLNAIEDFNKRERKYGK